MKSEVKEKPPIKAVVIKTEFRKSGADCDYVNIYLYMDDYKFELVPHCRTMKEKAMFYSLLARSPLALNK